jgi:glycine reductase
MSDPIRVVHFINAFYGGLGGEEAAQTPIHLQEGAVGPGRLLAQQLSGQGEVTAKIICGDGYFAEHEDDVAAWVKARLEALRPDVFMAGPAFRSGRYGLSCGRD